MVVVILSVFIVSNNAIFRYVISAALFIFSSNLPSLPPPKEPSLVERLAWGNRQIYTQHLLPLAVVICQSREHRVFCRALVDGARNRGSCLQSFKHQSQIHGFLGLSPVLFWRGVNPNTAGIKLVKTLQSNMAERSPEMVFQPPENIWSQISTLVSLNKDNKCCWLNCFLSLKQKKSFVVKLLS